MNRSIAPLKPAEEALVLDSTELDAGQVLDKVLEYCNRKLNNSE